MRLILVLDATDLEGCCSWLIEEKVRRQSEATLDLVPYANAQAWLKHLRHDTPTLRSYHPRLLNINARTSHHQPLLLKILKTYKPKTGSVTVGVNGYSDVTKELQSIQVECGMCIVDSPSVVFDEDDKDFKSQKKCSVLLHNVVKVEDVDDPISVKILFGTTSRGSMASAPKSHARQLALLT